MNGNRSNLYARANELRVRLEDRKIDALGAAEVGRRIFTEVTDGVRTRWLRLELHGYGDLATAKPLHIVLGTSASEQANGWPSRLQPIELSAG